MADRSAIGEAGDAGRVGSIDLVRGLEMVAMVLDHARDYFGDAKVDPTDLALATPALFFTRWATHFCAPTFVLLAGVSASLSGRRRSRGALARHLLARGAWLIVLEQTWCNVAMFFTYPHFVLGLVLWAIGCSMIALAGLIYLPRAAIGALGLAMIGLHNLLDGSAAGPGWAGALFAILHQPGLRVLPGGVPMLVGYPLIPWVGVMAVGYAIGPLFLGPASTRRPALVGLGLAATAGFVALRWSNLYGDPRPWAAGPAPLATAMSFLNCQKYPPSLLYLLMTLGPILIALGIFDRGGGRWAAPVRLIGQVPLFFYLAHWPIAHGLAVGTAVAGGYPVGWMFRFPPFQSPPGYGRDLGMVYLAWAVVVGIMYWLCVWYRRAASRRRGAA